MGVFHSQPVRVRLVCRTRQPRPGSGRDRLRRPAIEIIEHYPARSLMEVAFDGTKHLTGAGEARNRTKLAVERTAP